MTAVQQQAAHREALRRKFLVIWRTFNAGIDLATEALVFPDPPWRFDFANKVAKVVISIRMPEPDPARAARSELFAALHGWAVVPIWWEDIHASSVMSITQLVRDRAIQNADAYERAR